MNMIRHCDTFFLLLTTTGCGVVLYFVGRADVKGRVTFFNSLSHVILYNRYRVMGIDATKSISLNVIFHALQLLVVDGFQAGSPTFLPRCSANSALCSMHLMRKGGFSELQIGTKVVKMGTASSPVLGLKQILFSSSLIFAVSLVMRVLGLRTASNRIIRAATRMSLQLMFATSLILSHIFTFGIERSWVVVLWLIFVGIAASFEAQSRINYNYEHLLKDCCSSMTIGVGTTLAFTILFVLKLNPWWSPSTVVPIAGMLFGNSLTGLSLGINSLLSEYVEGSDLIELRLARGASLQEAVLPVQAGAIATAMTPTINAMSATGVITLPGMMTGQILGGQSPATAASYQIMIYFSICAAKCTSILAMSEIIKQRIFDQSEIRLRQKAMPRPKSSREKRSVLPFIRNNMTGNSTSVMPEKIYVPKESLVVGEDEKLETSSHPVIVLDQLKVSRTNTTVTMALHHGEVCGISGRSGRGKTQLLRTIIGLEKAGGGNVSVNGATLSSSKMCDWRSKVVWISQDRMSLAGTPNDFFLEISRYRSNSHKKLGCPETISSSWYLEKGVFDRPWKTLSGGEFQRAMLAIGLALNPSVLLLDEPSSACDKLSTYAIEKSLIESGIPIILVSHDQPQIDRMCSKKIKLH